MALNRLFNGVGLGKFFVLFGQFHQLPVMLLQALDLGFAQILDADESIAGSFHRRIYTRPTRTQFSLG